MACCFIREVKKRQKSEFFSKGFIFAADNGFGQIYVQLVPTPKWYRWALTMRYMDVSPFQLVEM